MKSWGDKQDLGLSGWPKVDPNAEGDALTVYNIARTRPIPAVRLLVAGNR